MFLALEPAGEAKEALARWRDELVGGREELRPTAPAVLHVTLVFLGWQAERDVDRIAGSARTAAAGMRAASLAPAGVRAVPPRSPRLFALELTDEDDRCKSLQGAVAGALAAERLYRPEKRPFWAHMTLARVKRGRLAHPLEPSELPGAFEAGRVTLYRSTLRPQGALYEPLAGFDLPS
jgi:RNA 2',3'-cyclic 3'-phosphodiesterase